MKKVLIACEFSGIVREEFSKMGHNAWSCDLLPSEIEGNHYQGDVREIINEGWDLMIAHPPCTYLASSGARWLYDKRYPTRFADREEAAAFFMFLATANIKKIALENPIGHMNSRYRKPDQIVHPYMFGEHATKATCLWLKGLPKLVPTNIISPDKHISRSGRVWDKWFFESSKISNKAERSAFRSKTFRGIAIAMATQWGVND